MKAAIINRWGSPDVFEISEVDKPSPKTNQLLIEVFSSSVNPVDWKQRLGNHKYILGAPFPIILGYDVCGKVVEAGKDIQKFKPGDIVFGDLDNKYGGALAEYAVGTENCFSVKPENIPVEHAAAVSLAGLTALQGLRDIGKIKEGQTVLINGASGGVGHLAVQIAKVYKTKVIAVASSKNKEFVEGFGCDSFIDYTKQDLLKSGLKVDLFFDVAGKYSFPGVCHLLNNGGVYINPHPRFKILFHKLLQAFTKSKKVKTFLRKHSGKDMEILADYLRHGKIRIAIDKTFSIDAVSEAHTYAEQGHTRGKNSIRIKSDSYVK